jgi:lambda family phage portal protein
MWPFRTRKDSKPKTRSFEAAAGGRRWEGAGWLSNINQSLAAGQHSIRARAQHASLNNPHAARAASAWTANVVGIGIRPQSTAGAAVDDVFAAWTVDADAAGRTDFYGLQAAVVRSVFVAGEAFIRFRTRRAEDGLAVPLQLELLDPQQIDAAFHRDLDAGGRIISGIEFDGIGRRVAYHVSRHAPGDPLGSTQLEPSRVPAEDILHVFEPLVPGQVRGISRFAPVLLRLRDLDELADAALMKAKIEAMFAGFLTDADGSMAEGAQDASVLTQGLEPGTLRILPPGSDIKFSNPTAGGETFAPFVSSQLHAIAAGLGLTYEQVSGDMSGVNYSSARVALIEFRRIVEAFRAHVLRPQFLEPVWRRCLTVAELAGVLPVGVDQRCRWVAPCWEHVDPVKDVQSDVLAVEAGFKSKRQVVAEWGRDPDEVATEIAGERPVVEAAA